MANHPVDSVAGREGDPAALFFDVDGTLIWRDKDEPAEGEFNDFAPGPSVYEAFRRLHERGHLTFLCTGRPLSLVSDSLHRLGFDGYVTAAGACVSFGDEVVYEEFIPREVLLECVRRLLDMRVRVLLESRTAPVALCPTHDPLPGFADIPVASSIDELVELAPDLAFSKISTSGDDWHRDGFPEFAAQHFEECFMGFAHELNIIGVNKGSGIRHALDYMGRGLHGTYAFGDSENDLPMFSVVETSIAMGNAMDEAKRRADYVTGHASGDGILTALEHFGLI